MKNLKKLIVFALIAVMAVSMIACNNGGSGDDPSVTATPKPTPEVPIVDITPEQLNNYLVKYTVTKPETMADEAGIYSTTEVTTNNVEVGYSSVILKSVDGGESYSLDGSGISCFSISEQSDLRSFFAAHLRYEKDELENKGTEVVAGKETTHYYYQNGLLKIHMYVDESFGSKGMCLKYVDEGFDVKTIEVTELQFGIIGTEGHEFVTYQQKVATPAPATDAAAVENP